MSNLIKQSTSVVVSFGPFLDMGDGVALETGLASALDHATTGIMISKNGGAFAVRNATVTASSYNAYGNYRVTLDTTDTATLGTLRMQYADAATCLPVWQDFLVVTANIWDSLFSTDVLDVNVAQWLGTAAATPTVAGVPEVDLTHVAGATTNVSALATNVDAIITDTGTTLENHLTDIKGTGFVKDTDSLTDIRVDTDLIDDGTSGLAKIATDAAAILVETDKLTLGDAGTGVAGSIIEEIENLATAAVCTEARLAELDAANLPADVDNLKEAGFIRRNTAVSVAAGSITLDAGASATADYYNNCLVLIVSASTGAGQVRLITDYSTGKVASITPNWTTSPTGTVVFMILPAARSDLALWQGSAPSALGSGRVKVDAEAISASTDAADKLEASADTMVIGTVDNAVFTATTTVLESDTITEATADHYNGRIIVFTSGTMNRVATDITDYSLVGGRGQFTYTAIPTPPADNETFVII